jgi:hypothetical protein
LKSTVAIMANFLYVDNSSFAIGGMQVSAVAKGIAPDIWAAMEHRILDYGWRADFGKLYNFAGGDRDGFANLYGSRPRPNDSLWAIAEAAGFTVTVHDRTLAGREKRTAATIVRDIMRDSYERMSARKDIVTLVAGDADYVPVLEDVMRRGIQFDVVFWEHAFAELQNGASTFVALDAHLDFLALE